MNTLLFVAQLNDQQAELVTELLRSLQREEPNVEKAPLALPTEATDLKPAQALSLVEARSRLAKVKSRNPDFDLPALIEKFGAAKLSDVDPKHFADLLFEAESSK